MRKGFIIERGLVLSLVVGSAVLAQVQVSRGSDDQKDAFLSLKSALLLTSRGEPGDRGPREFGPSSVESLLRNKLVDGTLSQFAPEEGQTPEGQDRLQWKAVEFNAEGVVEERGSCLYVPVDSNDRKVVILHAAGHTEAYVNGEPRGGDVYNAGFMHLPILLHEGTNNLFFRAGRGAYKVRLYPPPAPVFLHRDDLTLPDVLVGEAMDSWGAVVVLNATTESATDLTLTLRGPGLIEKTTPVPAIMPVAARKVGFRICAEAPAQTGRIEGTLELRNSNGGLVHSLPLNLEVVPPERNRRITFVSDIDGSVQYFSLRPATAVSPADPSPAIVLSCHGAGVEGHGQAGAYSPKNWFHIVAPTNRRPFGYDWEDFGRMDAMEVLDIAKRTLPHDPSRIYLTGHSMGGHGTWHLGVTYPDAFAAIAPSAGWPSRSGYGGRRDERADESAMGALVARCRKAGETALLSANLKQQGVYILHGGGDDNVPPEQAKAMIGVLEEFHHDWVYHEEPGMGHWWGNENDDGGSACVDWPAAFDLFARHALAPSSAIREIEFVTANPGVSSSCRWLAIERQMRHQDLSKANIRAWPNRRLFKGTTENVEVLRLEFACLRGQGPVTVELDGQTLADVPWPTGGDSVWFGRTGDQWRAIEKPALTGKGPHRYGAAKDELRHRFLFVYGTRGTPEENAWSQAKARYDAETFWYRGNGAIDIVADTAFVPSRYPDRTVVLYGNAATNAAWPALLGRSPVQVRRGEVQVGDHSLRGEDLSVLFVQPRPDSDVASVVVVGGSGPDGMRAAYPMSLFVSFVRYPDCMVTRPDPTSRRGVENVAVGFFGSDWSVKNGEFAFADSEKLATSQ
jgi:dienelactone hydrolase